MYWKHSNRSTIWATAFIYFAERRCGVWQGLSKCWFHLQNEIKTRWGDSKNEIGFDVHHAYEQNEIKTRPLIMEKCQNLRNEIKTRWGESVNLPYWGHRTNKSRRLYIGVDELHVFWMSCMYFEWGMEAFPYLTHQFYNPQTFSTVHPNSVPALAHPSCFPVFPSCSHLVLDNYSPFLGNAILVTVPRWGLRKGTKNNSLATEVFPIQTFLPTSCKVDMLCFNDRPKTHDWKDT